MGEELTRKPEQSAGQTQGSVNAGGNAGGRTTAGNPRTSNPPSGRTSTGGTTGGNTSGGKTAEIEGKKTTGLLPVSENVPTPETPKKNQKRKPKKKKSEPETFNAEQIAALILSASTIVGSRQGMEVFTLQPVEANQLATPIANMIAKSEALQNMGQYADAISLVTASLVIFAPRFMAYADQQKKKKIEASGGVKLVRKETKNDGSNGKSTGTRPSVSANDVASISSAIPATL